MLLRINKLLVSKKKVAYQFLFKRFLILGIISFFSSTVYSQDYNLFIRNYEDKLFYVSIDSVVQTITPRWGFQIIKVSRNAKKISVTNELNRTTEVNLDTAFQDEMYYEVFITNSTQEIKRSNRVWTVKSIANEPFLIFKPSRYNASKSSIRKNCELQFNSIDLIYLKANQIQTEEGRLDFLLKNIGKHCLRVDNILFYSQLFNSESIKLDWVQSNFLQTVDPENYRSLSKIFKTPAYKENFHVWLNQITSLH